MARTNKTMSGLELLKKAFKKPINYLKENKRLNEEAAREMDKRYPSGWGQSATKMTEVKQIKKKLKKK